MKDRLSADDQDAVLFVLRCMKEDGLSNNEIGRRVGVSGSMVHGLFSGKWKPGNKTYRKVTAYIDRGSAPPEVAPPAVDDVDLHRNKLKEENVIEILTLCREDMKKAIHRIDAALNNGMLHEYARGGLTHMRTLIVEVCKDFSI
jgi:hypothetical protein